jgi:predicted ATPase/class 3 adenylate cyclase
VRQSGQIPTGTVTLLFTDVEGSTRLWEAEPGQMAVALRRHDEILRAAIATARGYVFKTVGDAFCAAFWTAQAALDAALAAQRALGGEPWPTSRPVLVRMAMHSGVCEERDDDYFGPVVNRTARLEAIAHGGQVLVSGPTAELLSEALPDGITLRDLGPHRLKDLGRPEQVFQVEASSLRASFPPLASLDNPELPNNLPSVLSGFIGRDHELTEVRSLARSARLVTLAGAGGSGKTRLALQAAAELVDRTPDGVWLAELAPLTAGEQIPGTVAAVLGLAGAGGEQAQAALLEALTDQENVLILDNCEHVIDAAAKFCDEVIRRCPRVRIIATSREPLGIDGERVYRVPSMSLPAATTESAADLAGCDAAALFAERARMHDPGFVLSDRAAPLVATICRRLDGIPLALELAAARLSSMSLPHVCDRLDQRFRLLTGGSRNAMPRQQTLQAAVDWSFSLLTRAERETLARLSVFAGGFELEAAEAVCSTEGVDALGTADLLHSLVSKSLVVADRDGQSIRYRLLETIRQYGAQELLRLADDDQVLAIRARHADYYLALCRTAAPELCGRDQGEWMLRLDLEWDNLQAAASHLEAAARTADLLRLAIALERYTLSRLRADTVVLLRRAIGSFDPAPSLLLAEALVTAGGLSQLFLRKDAAELATADADAERALVMARELGDRRLEASALGLLGDTARRAGDGETLLRRTEDAVRIARELGDSQLLGVELSKLALAVSSDEDGRRIRREALECCRQSGDELATANLLHQMCGQDLRDGLIDDAGWHDQEALAIAERLGAEHFVYFLRSDLSLVRIIQDRHPEATGLVRACLLVARRVGGRIEASLLLLAAAYTTAWQGDHERAARLLGAADVDVAAALKLGTIGLTPPEVELREREEARLRGAIGDDAFEAAYAAGAQLSPAQAVELALSRQPTEPLAANSV